MNSPKVLLMTLRERTSATGNRYLSGWLGKARVVAFLDREAPEGETQWQVYAQTPEDRGEQGGDQGGGSHSRPNRSSAAGQHRRPRSQRASTPRDARRPLAPGELDDPIPF